MQRINISLTKEILDKLRQIKKRSGLTISDIIRRAAEKYIEQDEK